MLKLKSMVKPKTAIYLMNMGGPHDLKQVEPFLLNLFSDKDLIPLPFQKYLAKFIAKRRSPKIAEQYKKIGGGSPIRMWTEKQGELLSTEMDKISPSSAPHKCYVGFRYAAPLTEETLTQMKNDRVDRVVAFTLYPQYSCSTTGSSLNELHRHLKLIDPDNEMKFSVIDRWGTHPGLIDSFTEHIKKSLSEYPKDEKDDVILLFSAHSLPMSVVDRGDCYPGEVAATVGMFIINKIESWKGSAENIVIGLSGSQRLVQQRGWVPVQTMLSRVMRNLEQKIYL